MDIGIHSSSVDLSGDSIHGSALSEKGQLQQPAQSGTFSATLKNAAQNISMEESPRPSESGDPIEPIPSSDAEKQAVIALVVEAALMSAPLVFDHQTVSSPEAGHAEPARNDQRSPLLGVESVLPQSQNVSQVEIQGAGTEGQEGAMSEAVSPTSTDGLSRLALQSPIIPGQSSEVSVMMPKQTVSQTTDESLVWNDRVAHADLSSTPLNPPSSHSLAPSTLPQDSLTSDQGATYFMEHQGARNVLGAVYMNGGGQPLERPGTVIQPSMVAQEQEAEETTLLGEVLTVPVVGASEGRGQDPFGADAQEAGEWTMVDSGESKAPGSVRQDNQSSFFNGQFASARQAQSPAEGQNSSAVAPSALLEEDHSVMMTSGKAQAVHVELPAHDSGPLSVRISMTDQMVHTQFTTDRNDLGALLLTRQDQLQHTLMKSGFELGQFQVHIDQQGKQEALPDRQSRRNGEASEQQTASQDHKHETPNRERPNHGPARTLSLFA